MNALRLLLMGGQWRLSSHLYWKQYRFSRYKTTSPFFPPCAHIFTTRAAWPARGNASARSGYTGGCMTGGGGASCCWTNWWPYRGRESWPVLEPASQTRRTHTHNIHSHTYTHTSARQSGQCPRDPLNSACPLSDRRTGSTSRASAVWVSAIVNTKKPLIFCRNRWHICKKKTKHLKKDIIIYEIIFIHLKPDLKCIICILFPWMCCVGSKARVYFPPL